MALDKILTDGTETGATLAAKVNVGFDVTDTNETAVTDLDVRVTAVELSEVTLAGDNNFTGNNTFQVGISAPAILANNGDITASGNLTTGTSASGNSVLGFNYLHPTKGSGFLYLDNTDDKFKLMNDGITGSAVVATLDDVNLKQDDLGFGTAGQILVTNATLDGTEWIAPTTGSGGQVDSVVAGTNVTVDNTDPINPVVSSTDTVYDDTALQGEVNLKLGLVTYQENFYTPTGVNSVGILKDKLSIGDNLGDSSINLAAEATFDARVYSENRFSMGHFPNSSTHPDDFIIFSQVGGIVLQTKDENSPLRLRYIDSGTSVDTYQNIATENYVDTEVQGKQNDLGFGTAGQILATNATSDGTEWIAPTSGSGGQVDSVVAGTNVSIDNTDPINPVVSSTDTVYDDTVIQAEVTLNTAKVSNIDHPLVETAVPTGALFTDTDTVYDDTVIQAEVTLNTAKVGITTAQATDIADNSAHRVYALSHLTADEKGALAGTANPLTSLNHLIDNDTYVVDFATKEHILGLGTAGQVLATNAAADAKEWITPTGGSGGQVDSVVAGLRCSIDNTDPVNPIISVDDQVSLGTDGQILSTDLANLKTKWVNMPASGGQVDSVVAGTNVTVDNTDPTAPIVSSTDTVYDDTTIQAEVTLNTAKVSNVDHPLVEAAVPTGALFTDTTYSDVTTTTGGVLTDAQAVQFETNKTDITTLNGEMDIVNEEIPSLAKKTYVDKSIVNTYSGSTTPLSTLGKNNDRYREFPATASQEVFKEDSAEPYDSTYFVPFEDNSVPTGVEYLGISPFERTIEIWFIEADTDMDNMTFSVGGTNVPVTVQASSSHSITLAYLTASDTIIQGITTSTELIGNASVLTGKYTDFIKYDGKWIEHQYFSRPTITVLDTAMSSPVTKAEAIAALKDIPYWEDLPKYWGSDHDFYMVNTTGDELALVKYRSNGDTTEAGTNKKLWVQSLTEAV